MNSTTSQSILFVESNFNLAQIILPAITSTEFAIDVVGSGEDALIEITKKPYNIVVINQSLPDMTGLECFRQLQQEKPWLAVYFLISENQTDIIPQLLKLDASDFVVLDEKQLFLTFMKPVLDKLFTRQELYQQLREVTDDLEQRTGYIKAIFEFAPFEIYLKDTERKYKWVNRQWLQHYNKTEATAVGLSSHDILPQKTAETSQSNDKKVLETGLPTEEFQIIETSEGVKNFRTLRFPIKNSEDTITGIGIVAIDDTEKRLNEAILSSIFEDAPIGIALHAPDGRTRVRVNDAFCRHVGYSRQELLADSYEKLTYDEDLYESLALRRDLFEGRRETISFEKRYSHKEGHIVWGDVSTFVIRGVNGEVLHFVSYIQDITQRKKSEEQLVLLGQAVEASTDALVICNARKKGMPIISINSAFTTMTGYSEEECVGKGIDFLQRADTQQESVDKVNSALKKGLSVHVIFRHYKKNGKSFWNDVRMAPIVSSTGETTHFVGSLRDITESVTLETQIRHSQKMDAVGQLTGGVAHDFNNILGIVLGNLELIEELAENDDQIKKLLSPAMRGVERGVNITKRLLSFSRKKATGIRTTQVNDTIQNMMDLISSSLTVSIDINLQLSTDLWLTEINPDDLEDAILNLSLNARDAMPMGGTLQIKTQNITATDFPNTLVPDSNTPDYILLSVSDTGTGMTKEVSEKLFDPFFTTKRLGKGTGLGLSMVFGFVQRSKGFIIPHSKEGQGTIIEIYLPKSKSGVIKSENADQAISGLPEGSEHILIVDDEEDLANLATTYLQGLGYKISCALNGNDAMDKLTRDPSIDLLFSDVVMPGGVDGFLLSEKALVIRPNIKILLTSGFTGKKEADFKSSEKTPSNLVSNLLNKPYSRRDVALAVRKALDQG